MDRSIARKPGSTLHAFQQFRFVGRGPAGLIDPQEIPRAERAPYRVMTAGRVLTRALLDSSAFREQADAVRALESWTERQERALNIAARYGAGKHKWLMGQLIFIASCVPDNDVEFELEVAWSRPVRTVADRSGRGPYELKDHQVDAMRAGAVMVARRGAGLCLVEGCFTPAEPATHPVVRRHYKDFERRGKRSDYCSTHHQLSNGIARSHVTAMDRAMDRAVEAWPSVEERREVLALLQAQGGRRLAALDPSRISAGSTAMWPLGSTAATPHVDGTLRGSPRCAAGPLQSPESP
jgi:hypothetical protein